MTGEINIMLSSSDAWIDPTMTDLNKTVKVGQDVTLQCATTHLQDEKVSLLII